MAAKIPEEYRLQVEAKIVSREAAATRLRQALQESGVTAEAVAQQMGTKASTVHAALAAPRTVGEKWWERAFAAVAAVQAAHNT